MAPWRAIGDVTDAAKKGWALIPAPTAALIGILSWCFSTRPTN